MKIKHYPVLAILILCCFVFASCSTPQEAGSFQLNGRFSKTWPTADDLKWFKEAKGLTKSEVLKKYGNPNKIEKKENGIERWHYPWTAVAILDFKGDKVSYVWYDAGY